MNNRTDVILGTKVSNAVGVPNFKVLHVCTLGLWGCLIGSTFLILKID